MDRSLPQDTPFFSYQVSAIDEVQTATSLIVRNFFQHVQTYRNFPKLIQTFSKTFAKKFPQNLVGRISEKYNCAKQLIGFGILLSGVLSVLTPFMLDLGPVWFILTRLAIGILHAPVLCCSYTLFGEWLPKERRGRHCDDTAIRRITIKTIVVCQKLRFPVSLINFFDS